MDISQTAIANEAAPMADETLASVIPLHKPKKAKTGAERARAYRQRKKASVPAVAARVATTLSESGKVTPVTPPTIASGAVTPSRPRVAPILLTASAFALAVVGIIMNGWFARSLGSSDIAGLLFPHLGVAADLVALVIPSCAAGATTGHGAGRMDDLGRHLRLRRDGRCRFRLGKHRRRHACACVTGDASSHGRPRPH